MSGSRTTAPGSTPRTMSVRGVSLTLLLIALNLLVFAYQATLAPEQRDLFILRWSAVPMEVFESTDLEPTVPFPVAGTLLTALFLHADLSHLLINLTLLAVFGLLIERGVGFWRALAIFFTGGLLGGLAQIAANPLTLASLLGASGAIAALIGAALIVPRASHHTLIMVAWGGMQAAGLIDTLVSARWISGGLAIWSHLGGLLAGALLMLVWRRYSRGP